MPFLYNFRFRNGPVEFEPRELDAAVQRLLDSGRLMAPRPRPTEEQPNPSRQLVLVMVNLPAGFPSPMLA